jgi:hypothetical protein
MDQETTSLIWTIIAIVAIFYLLNYLMTCKEETSSENFQSGGTKKKNNMEGGAEPEPGQQAANNPQIQNTSLPADYVEIPQGDIMMSGPGPQANPNLMDNIALTSDHLLPSESDFGYWHDETNQEDSMFNEGPTLGDRNFLDCGYHYGINTVGQSLRNSNQQIRSDPPIPQVDIGPWGQSTYEPDLNRRQLEVGGDFDC